MRGSRTDYRTDTLTAGGLALVWDTFNGFHIVRFDLLTVSRGKVCELVQSAGKDTWELVVTDLDAAPSGSEAAWTESWAR